MGNLQGQGQYHKSIKTIEEDIQKAIKQVNELTGIKESDTGLAAPALWDLAADKQTLTNEQPLQVMTCDFSIKTHCRLSEFCVCMFLNAGGPLHKDYKCRL